MNHIKKLTTSIQNERQQLVDHPLYSKIDSIEALQKFMETHIFAVWDFMSLLKALQIGLTCTTTPWIPTEHRKTRKLINEIVFGEESDVDENGEPMSHFEMYVASMNEIGANTSQIEHFIAQIKQGKTINEAFETINVSNAVKDFVNFTFEQVNSGKLHVIAAVFTFGREDLIPDMFIEIVKNLSENNNLSCKKLIYYLERHIEVDGGEHGPMALTMINELCGNDSEKWEEATNASKKALEYRNKLWNSLL
jgi:hypothetical protein